MTYDEYMKKYHNTSKEDKEEKKQEKKPQSSYQQYMQKYGQVYQSDFSSKGSSMLQDFSSAYRSFVETANSDFKTLGYANARDMQTAASKNAADLRNRVSSLKSYFAANRSYMSDKDYTDAISFINSASSTVDNAMSQYNNSLRYYSQFATQKDYDDYVTAQKDYEGKANYDLDAAQKEIDELERRRDELAPRQTASSPTYYSTLSQSPYAASQQSSTGSPTPGHSASSPQQATSPYAAREQDASQQSYYREIAKLDKQISEKKQYLNQAKHIQEGITLAGVAENADFDQYSGYASTESDGFFGSGFSQYGMGYDDLTYEYINGEDSGMRQEILHKAIAFNADNSLDAMDKWQIYDHMKPDEIAIYNYYYAKDGKAAAQKYLDNIRETLNYRKATSMYKPMKGNTALELLFGVVAGLDQFESGIKNLFNTQDGYIPHTATQIASGMVREDLADNGPKLPQWLGGASLGQVGYDAITTTTNMVPSILTSTVISAINPTAGAAVGTALMGGSAAGNAYQEALNLGYDKGQARAYSTLIGASEAGLQYLLGGLGKLGGKLPAKALKMLDGIDNAFARTALKLGGSMLSEGLEEGLQEILTPLFKNWALQANEEINWGEVAYSGLLGALTAGFMEGPSTIAGEVKTYKQGKQLQKEGFTGRLKEIGSLFAADTVAYKLAGKVKENTGAYTIGRLFNEVGATLTEQNVSDITEALVAKGMDEKTARKNAEAVAAIVDGDNLTDLQVAVIESNDVLAEAVRTTIVDPNATWFQRSNGYNEALMALAQEKTSPKAKQTQQPLLEQENAPDANTVDTQHENGAEAAPAADVTSAKVKSIASISDDKVMLKLEDGSEVEAASADLDPEDGVIIETIAKIGGISANDANYILGMIKAAPGVNPQWSALGASEVYRYGFYGMSRDHITKHGVFSSSLTDAQRNAIYEAGRNARNATVQSKTQRITENATANATTDKNAAVAYEKTATGKVHFEGDRNALTHRQKASLTAMEKIADVLGVQIHVFESEVGKNGKRIGANGWYDPRDNSIHIDLHAGANGEGTMLFTLAHELTHHIRKWSPAKFKILSDFLMEEYGKKGVNVDGLVREQMAKAERNGRTISYDTAYEEVVADSMETMLSDGNVMKRLEKLKARDKDLWHKIKSFIDELAAKIRSIYKGLKPDSVEGQYVADMGKAVYRLQELFAEALVDASENYQSSITPGEEGVAVNQNGDPVAYSTEDGSVLLSMRTYEEDGRDAFRNYLQKCVASNKLTKAEMDEMLNGIEEIYQTCKEFKDKYAPFSAWSDAAVVRDTHGRPVFSVVTPNGDYKMNLDFSLVCKKRRTLDAVFNEMSRRGIIDDFELGQKSVVKINEIIRKYGLETACALCFVDAKRFRQASMADSFTKLYNELVLSLVPENQKGSIDHFNFSGYDTIKKVEGGIHTWDSSKLDFSHLDKVMRDYGKGTVEHKAAKYIKSHAEGRKLLLRGDFMSSHGFDAVKTQNRDILRLYNSKKGTGGPKAAFGDVQYMNEIIKKARTWTPAKAYSVGGVRIQSFSDYVPRMVFDYTQMIYDLAATKLPAHAYTKEALFVKQFGLTGVKINMSLIPAVAEDGIAPGLDANGNYVWAGESFDYETAKEIQNAEGYTENCGTICVGVSYDHIMKLLRDPNIRMVIPYHKSGLNPIVAHMNKIAQFHDYTNDQRTKDKSGKALDKDFDFSKALHDMGDNASPKAVADQYLKWCAANGHTPRFAEFAMEDNYYKLLEDFTLYDKDGNYVPQREVRAVFPKADSAFGSMKDLIEAGLEEDAVVEGKRDSSLSAIVDEIQKTLPRTEAEIAEEQVEQADRDLEADVKYSSRDYSAQVDEVKNNTHDRNNHVYMGATPTAITKVLDLPKLPMLITSQHIYSMAVSKAQAQQEGRFKSRYNYHNLGWDAVKKLPEGINKPVLIIKSNTDPNDATFVVVTAQVDNAGNPIIAAVKPNGRGNYFNIEFPTNFVLSGYGKDGIHGYVARAKTENRILYANKNSQKTKNTTSVQFADNILSSDYTANLARFKGIVKSKFVGTIFENSGLPKFSDRDSDGNQLSEGQMEFFKDSVVRDNNGSLMVMYHGTANGGAFTVFDGDRLGNEARTSQIGQGFYFTNAKAEAESYTTNVDIYGRSSKGDNPYLHQVYLNITNPFNVAEDALNLDDVKALYGDGTYDYFFTNWIPFYLNRKSVNGEVLTKAAVQAMSKNEKVSLYVAYLAQLGTKELLSNMVRAFPYGKQGELLIAMKNRLGYDGIVEEYAPGKYQYVAFSSEQIKLVGNKNPTGDSDIRYSDRDSESVSNRSLLANAFEGVVQNDIEKKKLQEYKAAISNIEAQEQKLRELNAQIRELSFAKGKRDTQKIRELRDEAIKTRNRIGIYDSQLLRLEASKPLQNVLAREKKKAYQRAEQKGKEALDAYRLEAEAKQSEILRDYREANAALRGQQSDAAIMEKEFVRIVKAYERLEAQSTRKSGKDAKTIADLRSALREESKKRNADQKTWEAEFDRLLREYEASGRNIAKLEGKIERQRANAKAKIESREKTAMRHKIQKVVGELNQLLLNESKDRHVPDSLKKAVADALALVNMDTVDAEQRAAKYADLIAQEQAKPNPNQDKIDAYTATMENILRQGDKIGQRLKELRDAYEDISQSEDPDIANAYDPVIAGCLKELSGSIGNTSLGNMTIEQLSDVYDMYRMVLTRVRDANKSFLNAKKESISQLASRVVGEVRRVGGEHKYRASALDPIKGFLWNNLKPVYAFEHLGSQTLTEVFNGVRAGEDTWAKDVTDARAYYLDKSKKYSYDKWDFRTKYQFESDSGIPFELTLEQILSLYAYSKRDQAHEHLRLGGFVFDSNIETTKEKGGIIKYKVNTADAHQISIETLADIISTLSADQKGFVDEMQDYLSTTMGAKGNEVTMQMYGVKLFKEKHYFPLKSAKQFMFEQNEVSGEVRIKNSGFTNKTIAKANNPIILNNFMDVWSGHVNDMSMYHAFVLPLEDFNRVFNYNSPKKEGQPPVSVKGTIQNAYSPAAVSYVRNLITDLNGGARTDSTTGFINKMMGMFKKGAVFASLSVVVQQPSAIARAVALVDAKYFIGPKVDHKRHKALWDEVKQYAPVAIIKEMGYFDTNMGRSTQDFITAKEYSGFTEKMKALVTDSGYRDEILSKAPALADELAWCSIWEAVKRETQAKNPGMDVKSDAFLQKAGQRFTEVITKTQVYDSVLSRSAHMRSKDTGMKMATAFMAEPTTSINMIADALLQAKRGNRRYCRAAIGAVIASNILNSILVSFVYAGRDDDEDKTYWEKYLGTLAGETLDSLNIATYIPFIKDIVSIAQGYDVERSDMAVISDLFNAWKKLDSGTLSPYRKVEAFAGSVAQIFGLPVKNIMRDVRGIYQTIESFMNGQSTTKAGIGYAVKSNIPKWMGGGEVSNQNQLYEAILSGDKTQIDRVKSRYKDEDAVSVAIRKALRENDPRVREAAQAQMNGDPSERVRIARLIIADGFTQDDVVRAINSEITALTSSKAESGEKKEKGFYSVSDFTMEIANGDEAAAYAARTDIIRMAQKGGKTAEEAEKSFNSSAKSELKELFLEGEISEQKAIQALSIYCGVDEEDAKADVQYWAFKQDYPDVYADDSWFDKYYEEVAASGVEIDMYMDYRNRVKDITGDGKKERRMAVIDSLPISDEQKDALYFAEGWAASKIDEAPWHR